MKISEHHITLQHERITLRPMTEDDWEVLLKWNSDSEVLYYAEGAEVKSYTLEQIQDIYRGVCENAFCFIIEFDGKPVGECWLQRMNLDRIIEKYPGIDCRRIDLMIGDKMLWGKGIGTQVIQLLTELGFEEEKADLIFGCDIADYNHASRRAFQKNGYQLDAIMPQPPGMKAKTSYDLKKINPRLVNAIVDTR